jgi:formate/nitrite transporter FocA (FNT family)
MEFTTVAVPQKRLSVSKMLIHWIVTFFGNLAGSLLSSESLSAMEASSTVLHKSRKLLICHSKADYPWMTNDIHSRDWSELARLACYLGTIGRELFSTVVEIWWPTFAFVSLGIDHVVANSKSIVFIVSQAAADIMKVSFIPICIWQGAPGITVGL